MEIARNEDLHHTLFTDHGILVLALSGTYPLIGLIPTTSRSQNPIVRKVFLHLNPSLKAGFLRTNDTTTRMPRLDLLLIRAAGPPRLMPLSMTIMNVLPAVLIQNHG